MTMVRQKVGRYGEDVAVKHLRESGHVIVARNWRCPEGEIDVIARLGSTVVFCEVKTRRSSAYGSGADAVHWRKARTIRRVAAAWLSDNEKTRLVVRFDVISVVPQRSGPAKVEHIREAF